MERGGGSCGRRLGYSDGMEMRHKFLFRRVLRATGVQRRWCIYIHTERPMMNGREVNSACCCRTSSRWFSFRTAASRSSCSLLYAYNICIHIYIVLGFPSYFLLESDIMTAAFFFIFKHLVLLVVVFLIPAFILFLIFNKRDCAFRFFS